MIRNIYFDMGGVVFRQDTQQAFDRFRAIGIDPDYYMGAYGQKDFFLDLEMGHISAEAFCQKLSSVANRPISWEEAQYCWLGFIKDIPQNRLDNLIQLKNRFHIGLLSNTNPFIMAFTRSSQFSTQGHGIGDFLMYCIAVMKWAFASLMQKYSFPRFARMASLLKKPFLLMIA